MQHHHIIGVPEGVENEQGMENLFEEIVTENLHLVKEKMLTGPGSTESPKGDGPKEAHNRIHHN